MSKCFEQRRTALQRRARRGETGEASVFVVVLELLIRSTLASGNEDRNRIRGQQESLSAEWRKGRKPGANLVSPRGPCMGLDFGLSACPWTWIHNIARRSVALCVLQTGHPAARQRGSPEKKRRRRLTACVDGVGPCGAEPEGWVCRPAHHSEGGIGPSRPKLGQQAIMFLAAVFTVLLGDPQRAIPPPIRPCGLETRLAEEAQVVDPPMGGHMLIFCLEGIRLDDILGRPCLMLMGVVDRLPHGEQWLW